MMEQAPMHANAWSVLTTKPYILSTRFPSHADIASQGQVSYIPVHIINLEIQDNHEEATLGAFQILELCELVCPHLLCLCLPHSLHASQCIPGWSSGLPPFTNFSYLDENCSWPWKWNRGNIARVWGKVLQNTPSCCCILLMICFVFTSFILFFAAQSVTGHFHIYQIQTILRSIRVRCVLYSV